MLFTILAGRLFLRERIAVRRLVGLLLLLTGVAVVGWSSMDRSLAATPPGSWRGDLMFCLGGALWAGYTILFRRSGWSPLVATSLVAVISMFAYLPIYACLPHSFAAPLSSGLVVQAVFQGVLAGVLALLFHTAAVARLGAGRASTFAGAVPVLAVALSAAVLHEEITLWELLGLAAATTGMALAVTPTRVKRTGRQHPPETPARAYSRNNPRSLSCQG